MWYKLTNNQKMFDGHKLTQIEYIKKINEHLPGSLGGWIESENNISQDFPFSFPETAIIFGKHTSVKTFCCLRGNCIIGENVCLSVSEQDDNSSLIIEKSYLSGIKIFVDKGNVFIGDTKVCSNNDSIVVIKNIAGKIDIQKTVICLSQKTKIINNFSKLIIAESNLDNPNFMLSGIKIKILKSNIKNISNTNKTFSIEQDQGMVEINKSSLFFSDDINIKSQNSTIDINYSELKLNQKSTVMLNDSCSCRILNSKIENELMISCKDNAKAEILSSELCSDTEIKVKEKSSITISTSRFFAGNKNGKISLSSTCCSSVNIFDSRISDSPILTIKNSNLLMQKARVKENALVDLYNIDCEIEQSKLGGNSKIKDCYRIYKCLIEGNASVKNVDIQESDIFGDAKVGYLPKDINLDINLPILVNCITAKAQNDFMILRNKFSSKEEWFCSYYSKENPTTISVLRLNENENNEYLLSELVKKQKEYADNICSSQLFNKIERAVAGNAYLSMKTFKENIIKERPDLKNEEIVFISIIPWLTLLESIFNNTKSDEKEKLFNEILDLCNVDFSTKKIVFNKPIDSIYN